MVLSGRCGQADRTQPRAGHQAVRELPVLFRRVFREHDVGHRAGRERHNRVADGGARGSAALLGGYEVRWEDRRAAGHPTRPASRAWCRGTQILVLGGDGAGSSSPTTLEPPGICSAAWPCAGRPPTSNGRTPSRSSSASRASVKETTKAPLLKVGRPSNGRSWRNASRWPSVADTRTVGPQTAPQRRGAYGGLSLYHRF